MSNQSWIHRVSGLIVHTLLIALCGAALVLAQQTGVVELGDAFPGFTVAIPWAGLLVGLIGLALCAHMCVVAHFSTHVPQEDDTAHEISRATFDGAQGTFLLLAGLFGIAFLSILLASGGALLGACGNQTAGAPRQVTLLSINDVYRIEGVERGQRGGLARVRSLRKKLEAEDRDLLVLHAGDAIYPSLMSKTYDGEQMIDVLNLLDGARDGFDKRLFATFGNHEFDKGKLKDVAILANRVKESGFTWLRTNIAFATDKSNEPLVKGENLKESVLVTANGVKVGLFSLTIGDAKPDYVVDFGDVVAIARRTTQSLRDRGADIVVALTHLTVGKDMEILHELRRAGPDVIIGGHEHTRQRKQVGGRSVLKADADAVSALVVRITVKPGEAPIVAHEFVRLAGDMPLPDAEVQEKVAWWQTKHDTEFCDHQKSGSPTCLDEPLGTAAVTLEAEEEKVRACESNLGNWITDQMRTAFPDVDAAFINSGSFRLNENLKPGPILLRDIESLLYYDSELKLIEIGPDIFRKVVDHAVSGWPGNGRWLQISGFTFSHDTAKHTADALFLLNSDGTRKALPTDRPLKIVTTRFLIDPAKGNQDEYRMLNPDMEKDKDKKGSAEILLKALLKKSLKAAGDKGIDPKIEKRIVQTENDICDKDGRDP